MDTHIRTVYLLPINTTLDTVMGWTLDRQGNYKHCVSQDSVPCSMHAAGLTSCWNTLNQFPCRHHTAPHSTTQLGLDPSPTPSFTSPHSLHFYIGVVSGTEMEKMAQTQSIFALILQFKLKEKQRPRYILMYSADEVR